MTGTSSERVPPAENPRMPDVGEKLMERGASADPRCEQQYFPCHVSAMLSPTITIRPRVRFRSPAGKTSTKTL